MALCAAAAFTAAVVAAASGASASTGAQDSGRILFASDVAYYNAHASLYTIGVDGRGRRRLMANVDNTQSVRWSPDGSRIAWFRNGAIFVVPARGGSPRVVAHVRDRADASFSWSPDGTRIAFFDFDIAGTLVVVRVGTQMLVHRFQAGGIGLDAPAWSPDGKRIAFIRDRGKTGDLSAVDLSDGRVSVLLRGAVGSSLAWSPDGRAIAYDFESTIVLAELARHIHRVLNRGNAPSWSPDGRKLAVTRRLDNAYVIDARTGRSVHVSTHFTSDLRTGPDAVSWTPDSRRIAVPVRDDVYLVRADGRGRTRVTQHGRATELLTVPSLAPNGRRVAYVAAPRVAQVDDLYSVRPDGSGLRALTSSLGADQPVWSPDRGRIAFTRLIGLDGTVMVMRADGSGVHVVASGFTPAWTPDGRRLTFARDGDIYTVNADGGPAQLLVGGPTVDFDPAWSRDGTRIAFARRSSAGAPADVWTAAADGSGAARLTHIGDASDHCNLIEGFSPAWSPDGTEIAYVRGVGVGSPCFFNGLRLAIRAIHTDGTGDRPVTSGGAAGNGGASDPAWSPDGARIAFTVSEQLDPREDTTYRIGVVDRSGSGLRIVVGRENAQDPDWR